MVAALLRFVVIFLVLAAVLASVMPVALPVAAQTTSQAYETARRSYRGQLDEYRTSERQYTIAIEQYAQLNTLAALEELIQQTHTTMKLRNQVLISYLTLLQMQMEVSTGINLDQKARTIAALKADISNLNAFQEKIQVEPNRQKINEFTQEFESIAADLEKDAYLAQILLAHGRLQTVYDKTLILHQEIETTTSEKIDIAQSQRQRANLEIRDSLVSVKGDIDEMLVDIARAQTQYSKSSFDGSQSDLTQVYVGLAQTLSYLEELLQM